MYFMRILCVINVNYATKMRLPPFRRSGIIKQLALIWEKNTLAGVSRSAALQNNDACRAPSACKGLIRTGSTGNNDNDLSALLIGR